MVASTFSTVGGGFGQFVDFNSLEALVGSVASRAAASLRQPSGARIKDLTHETGHRKQANLAPLLPPIHFALPRLGCGLWVCFHPGPPHLRQLPSFARWASTKPRRESSRAGQEGWRGIWWGRESRILATNHELHTLGANSHRQAVLRVIASIDQECKAFTCTVIRTTAVFACRTIWPSEYHHRSPRSQLEIREWAPQTA